MSTTTPTAAMASEPSRERKEQILSAKKKLKSYRAKQALMAQAQKRSSTSSSHSRTNSGIRSTDAPSTSAVAEALSNQIVSQASTSASATTSHSRAASRGHGRGHSRAGSISITPNALWSQAQALTSTPAAATTSTLGRPASIVASTAGNARRHSRTHSRNLSISRLVSISMLGAKKDEPVVLAIEHHVGSDNDHISTDTQRLSQQFLDSSALFGGAVTSDLRPSSTASAKRLSNLAPVSPALFDRSAPATAPSPAAPSSSHHSRRMSRHNRTTSIATKRESMEIMGGLGTGLGLDISAGIAPLQSQSITSSRRRSSRMSNLPSASVLFGTAEQGLSSENKENQQRTSVQQWDWRKAFADAGEEQEEGAEGRLTALEKLEGRKSIARNAETETSSPFGAAKRASKRLSNHTRTESIQIPNLDEIHQQEISERRASWNAQANGTPVSSTGTSTASRRESWGRGLVPPVSSSSLSNGFSSPLISGYLASPKRPESMILRPESPQPEGLGTLMEEEEEEDASPFRERSSLDMPVDGSVTAEPQARKQRSEIEEELVKRNRRASLRASLAPKPLKLKSRPPSLYLTPQQRNGLTSSPSMPHLGSSPLMAGDATPRISKASPLPDIEGDDESQIIEQPEEAEGSFGIPSRSTTCPDLTSYAAEPAPREEKEVTAEEVASQEQRQLEELQKQILRAHRNSVIAPAAAATSSSIEPTITSASSRQGMRTLRLGSQASLASIMEPVNGRGSSINASTTTTTTSTPAQRRRSLIMGPMSTASSSRDSDYVPFDNASAASTTGASSRAARRSSIIYKPATASAAESGSSHSASNSIASVASVPLAVHDELKARANRDAALLESTRKQVEMLERELANEAERSAREKAELEQWNSDKEEHLFERAQRAEEVARVKGEAEVAVKAELEQVKEMLDDLRAEREVLQDDIEGWRSRCQDLEKTLRTEKAKANENRKLRAAARLRIKQLSAHIEQTGGVVPADELGVLGALEMPQLDLASVLRSPNLGALSPNLNSTPAGLSPSLGPEDVPPQITKLLADMRQQIFNLAGSLEHERKQHLAAKEEVVRLQGEKQEQAVQVDAAEDSSRTESFSSGRRSSGMMGKNKRHVFAYDSSMGSFGQSQSSASLSMTATDDTVHTDSDSERSDSFSGKLPSSESELIGLGMGMGGLKTLDEIEEVSEMSESVADSNGTQTVDAEPESPKWIDVEAAAGGMDVRGPSMDLSEASYQDAEHSPPTPDLYRHVNANEREHGAQTSSMSICSSADSYPAPSTPHAEEAVMRTPPSPRPEFHREWSFEWGKSRSRRCPSAEEGVEDFFGILKEDVLPPLSTSEEPLDLPPIMVQNGTILPTAKINKYGRPVYAPAQQATAGAGARVASIFGGRRPPVARSAYLRESFDSNALKGGLPQHHGYGHEAQVSSVSSLAALGSRALSRVSLQGLTGAFSGLSGYLTNQSGAAVMAAQATIMCTTHEDDLEGGAAGWMTQKREWGNEDEVVSKQLSWSSGKNSSAAADQPQANMQQRRFVRKSRVQVPKATQVWMLDFTRSTEGMGVQVGPVFTL